jgi:hypothetical protein
MASTRAKFHSLYGRRLGIGSFGELAARGGDVKITNPAVDATITISAEAATTADTRDIAITLKDASGIALNYAAPFKILMFSSSAMTDYVAAGGSTGVVQGTAGKLLAIVAKKYFHCLTDANGAWVGTYLDTGTAAGYLAVELPNGVIIPGGTITNA